MSTADGRFDDGPSGPVRVADFDALDEDDEAPPAVRVASFDLDEAEGEAGDETGDAGHGSEAVPASGIRTVDPGGDAPDAEEPPRARVVSFDGELDDAESGSAPRRARFDGAPAVDRRARRDGTGGRNTAGDRDRTGRPRRGRADRDGVDRRGAGDTGVVEDGAAAANGAPDGGDPDGGDPDGGDPDGGGSRHGGSKRGGSRRDRSARGESPARGGRGGNGRGADAGPPPDDETRAKEICLRLLTDRARTVKELRDALLRKEIPEDVADRVLERFDEVGLVDDEAFAGQWVRSRHQHRGLGRRAIAQELRRKGVAKEIADEALTEIDTESEQARARELVDRRMRTLKVGTREERASASRRLVGMLARKGYGAGVAYSVVREAIAARGAEEDELGDEPAED